MIDARRKRIKRTLNTGLRRKKLTQFLVLVVLISVTFFSGKRALIFENQM
jgi:hypothetical protein